ncbi:polyphosphate polymerase domain-containing protein [Candidatus Saccharibacteria bacterium]|nr:polyphosphate polymerase domain-containing protein [Candidatus Saccharibacteria bacterium]
MDEKIFDRVEKKYVINKDQKAEIMRVIDKKMSKGKYHKSRVMNIYFDTDNYDLIIKSIEKPEFKQKLRARSYGGYDKVFLEIKTKLRGKDVNVGYKRRVLITKKDYDNFIKGKIDIITLAKAKIETADDIQIAKEVDYMVKYFDLKPKILVYYDRTSFLGEDSLRITFDENLKYRDKNLKFVRNSKDKHYFYDEKNIIMEIKAAGVMPLWLTKTLSKIEAYPTSFSKIGKIYELIRKEQNV